MDLAQRPDDSDVEPVRKAATETTTTTASGAYLVSCVDQDVRICTYYLPEHDGVVSCIIGYQICSDNQWGQCIEGVPVDGGSPVEPERSF
jgi:hypothetical protein